MTTQYHLFAPGDELRYALETSSASWTGRDFDDSSWTRSRGAMPPTTQRCAVRLNFNLGPEYAAYSPLDLALEVPGTYDVWLNGELVAEHVSDHVSVPAGRFFAEGNVLALALDMPQGTAGFEFRATLDGEPRETGHPRIVKGPYLLAPTETGITVAWETNVNIASTLIVDGRSYDGGHGKEHATVLGDLLAGATYSYTVDVEGQRSAPAELTTAAKRGERVRFIVYGDTRTDGDTHRRVVQAMVGERPDFVLNTGDMVGQSDEPEWQKFFAIEHPLLTRTPIIPTLGNHEHDFGDSGRFAGLFRKGGDTHYSVDYGDAHVAVVDSNRALGDQAAWLDGDLGHASAQGSRHAFVIMHWGPFAGGHHGGNDAAVDVLLPVMRKHRVRAVFSGHNHFYERGKVDGLTYFVTGGGGAPLKTPEPTAQTQFAMATHHYLIVDVAGPLVNVEARDPVSDIGFDWVTLGL